jgi:hypothetical protein
MDAGDPSSCLSKLLQPGSPTETLLQSFVGNSRSSPSSIGSVDPHIASVEFPLEAHLVPAGCELGGQRCRRCGEHCLLGRQWQSELLHAEGQLVPNPSHGDADEPLGAQGLHRYVVHNVLAVNRWKVGSDFPEQSDHGTFAHVVAHEQPGMMVPRARKGWLTDVP